MWPKDKREWKMLTFFLCCIAFGTISAITLRDIQWFERSGSLIIVLSLCFFWRDYIDSYERETEEIIEKENEFKNSTLSLAKINQIENPVTVIHFNYDIEARKRTAREKRKRYSNIEIMLGIAGTVIWGYGEPALTLVL